MKYRKEKYLDYQLAETPTEKMPTFLGFITAYIYM